MRYSPEALEAFVEAAALGSFSAAARKLKKSHSTISIAIANFEADIGCSLFDRGARQPVLNEAGKLVLAHVNEILAGSQRLDALAVRLAARVEPLLSVVMTDIYSLVFYEIISRFAERFQDTELRCGPSEDADVIHMIQAGQVHLGIVAAQASYPADVASERLHHQPDFGVYVSANHELAKVHSVKRQDLESIRQLYIRTYAPSVNSRQGQAWSAPDYLTLMEFAGRGFGWAALPRAMAQRFGKGLIELDIAGYPKIVSIDIIWSKKTPLGPAGQWLVEQLLLE